MAYMCWVIGNKGQIPCEGDLGFALLKIVLELEVELGPVGSRLRLSVKHVISCMNCKRLDQTR